MSGPNPKRQKVGRQLLDTIFADASNCWVIHYSCESFYDRPEGRSPRITSIAVRRLDTAQTLSFSIHQIAERRHIPFVEIENHYDDLERTMLSDFFEHVRGHQGMKYLHWNMRDINFGFAAIEHRYRVLGDDPFVVADDRKIDLARLLIDVYGVGYAGHPRLEKLMELNHIKPLNFMTGAQEAEAFANRNFVGLHQSTLRKVDVISDLLARAQDRHLRTNTTWWEMHGGRVRTGLEWLGENKLIVAFTTITSLIGFGLALWGLR